MLRRNTPPPLSNLSQQRITNTEPVSPGAISTASFMSSFSWVADKSSTELTALLKNAYTSLREKDKDLALAAEIGKSLLDNNVSLKSRYEDLLDQVNRCNQSLPSPSIDDGGWDSAHGSQEEDNDDNKHYSNDDDEDCDDATMRLISNQNAREALIEALERKNAEMQHMLDNALNESAASGQANEKQVRKLQNEIDLLKSNLECAVQKIQEMEESQTARQERAAARGINNNNKNFKDDPNKSGTTPFSCNVDEEDQWIAEELAEKMAKMQSENNHLVYAKKSIEEKLETALSDLDNLRQQFHQFQFTQQGYDNLQEAYQRQFKHIEELTTSLEDHRTILSRLRDRGIGWSPKPSPSPSEYGGGGIHYNSIGSMMMVASAAVGNGSGERGRSHSCNLQDLRMTTPKQSLLGELENAWFKNSQHYHGTDDNDDDNSNSNNDVDDHDTMSEHHHQSNNDLVEQEQNEDEGHGTCTSDADSCLSLTKLREVASLTEQNLASFYRAPAEYAFETLVTSTGFNKEHSIIQDAARYIKRSVKNGGGTSSVKTHSVKGTSIKNGSIMDFDMFSPGGSGSVYAAHDLYPRLSSELLFTSFDCRYNRSVGRHYAEHSNNNSNSMELFRSSDKPSGVTGNAYWVLQSLFHALCQWCRFSLVLMTAILINLWQGPDAIMEK